MSRYVSKYVVCPFYRRNDTNRICCEGVDKSNTINLVFESKEKTLDYERVFCNDIVKHKDCLICRMLMEKWSEEDGKG